MPQSSAASAQAQTRTEAAYSRWAPIYDLIFDLPFHPGRLAAARAAAAAAGTDGAMLVVGVGTGLELELLPADLRVTGVDISAAMLDIARERVARKGLRQVRSLQVMDAGAMDFADGQFDVALAPYVMSVVPNPARVLERDVARRAARRADGGDEPFRRRGRPARRDRGSDGKGRLVARLASEVSLCGGRRLDRRPAGRRADRAARAVAAQPFHPAGHRQARPGLTASRRAACRLRRIRHQRRFAPAALPHPNRDDFGREPHFVAEAIAVVGRARHQAQEDEQAEAQAPQ